MGERYFVDFEKIVPRFLTEEMLQKAKETAEKINELKFDYYQSRKITFEDLMYVINI